ncbi:MAG: hypothetical protein H7336_05490 [Bacteriovorax sp.]|nr:hypothetical protein [Bacteriovorax sp.]
MNNIYNKTTKEKYIPINDITINILTELNCIKSWPLYHAIAKIQSFKNGLVGVFEDINYYQFLKFLSPLSKEKLNTDKVQRVFKKLEKAGLIKIINNKPLIISLVTAEQAEDLNTMEEVLDYVQANETEFNFHILHKRANKFYTSFNRTREKIVLNKSENTIAKELKLDEIVKTRKVLSQAELEEALEWQRTIAHDDDPFENHLKENNKYINKKIDEVQII